VERVRIRRLVIRNYASPTQYGAIQGDNGFDWVVEDNVVHNNLVIGIRTGRRWRVSRNKVYRNGTIGISGFRADGTVIEANEVYENNFLQAPEEPIMAEASGMKFLRGLNMVIRNNYVHHNRAKGIWIDGNYPTTIVEGNRVSDNHHAGIWIEVSFGAIVRQNLTERNGPQDKAGSLVGYAGIQVTNSPDVQIYGNTVLDNSNGIGVMQSATPIVDATYGVLEVRNLDVHDNTVRMRIGRTGLVQIIGAPSYYTSKNNRFQNNRYYLGTNATYFAWSDTSLNETQWKAAGNDVTGTFAR
jgi:parallel beta-helix repeat protein